MDSGWIPKGLIDFQSEWVENGLELMAKGMRTQPTSRTSIPTSQNLDFGTCCCICCIFTCFGTQNRVSPTLHEKCLTGGGCIDADCKVSALKVKIISDAWTEHSKLEFKYLLTTKSWIWGLWVFSDWVAKRSLKYQEPDQQRMKTDQAQGQHDEHMRCILESNICVFNDTPKRHQVQTRSAVV